ncbi:NADH:ubiquinone reductase (Na(+)-transporting) subunit A [Candidatus Endobugula sertula]|uniref:Na(+)-translocating NADH-quinone reductase subunit A n=1 Tax=Candidatus Endobugula sertula TaxID=62101 RepID=A0A1D2QSR8_9GAMM|nr:NADH:ubiquinone reductase (Na(+)-transporting) subunit A [Candidatus Endobugula sertula]
MIKIRQGLELPISGSPEQVIYNAPVPKTVAVIGPDYHGMKPTMAVKEGDRVKLGQLLFCDKKTDGVKYTAPASGTVIAINRGARRVLQSVVIEINGDEKETFARYSVDDIAGIEYDKVVENLVESGSWTAFRTRPYSKVPAINSVPASIFVTAMDTNPLAADPAVVITTEREAFNTGLLILTKLTEGNIFVCKAEGADFSAPNQPKINIESFSGIHPAGNAGTHIHYLDPVNVNKTVWTIGYQEVIAIGHLFLSGSLYTQRVVSLAGPRVTSPRLLKTQLGANIDDLCAGSVEGSNNRIIAGSVFGGRTAQGPFAFLGRYHNQITVLQEGNDRPFLHYLRAGTNSFSMLGIYISSLLSGKKFDFTTTTNGSERAMVPIGTYENIMPLDILPTQLLRALIVEDTEMAQKLGCLELDEEDLALCTFVCPGKYEYGPILRNNLTRIEMEG